LSKLANAGTNKIDFNEAGLDPKESCEKYLSDYGNIRLKVNMTTGSNITQESEFTINIPELGNAISKMWDIVFDVDDDGTRKTNLNRIPPTDKTEPKRSENLNTLAGCLNHCAELLGYHCFYTSLDGSKNDAKEYSKGKKTSYYWDLSKGIVYKYYDQAETTMFTIDDKTGNI
jgi:hypothetical protein